VVKETCPLSPFIFGRFGSYLVGGSRQTGAPARSFPSSLTARPHHLAIRRHVGRSHVALPDTACGAHHRHRPPATISSHHPFLRSGRRGGAVSHPPRAGERLKRSPRVMAALDAATGEAAYIRDGWGVPPVQPAPSSPLTLLHSLT